MIDRDHALPITRQAQSAGHEPRRGVLPAAAHQRGRSGADAPHRRVAPGVPLHGRATAAPATAARGRAGRPAPHRHAHAAHGHRGAGAAARHQQARAGPQDLPVPAAQAGDRPFQPGLGAGHDLHPDGARLRVPDGRGGRGQPPGAGAQGGHHAGGVPCTRGHRAGLRPLGHARDRQHRPGQPVHGRASSPTWCWRRAAS